MSLFAVTVLAVVIIWALCSLAEAAMYAVRMPYVRQLAESGSRSGTLLLKFKQNIEQPISAILIVNTAVSAAGAAIVGAQARTVFGDGAIVWFSACFTVAVLFVSEIIPKVLGVTYSRPVSLVLAAPLDLIIKILYPLVWIVQKVFRLIEPKQPVLRAPEDEVQQMAMISAEEGSILPYEAELVRNVLALDQVTTHQIMTPRNVVQKFRSDWTLGQLAEKNKEWTYSRIPLYAADDPETWIGFVLSREVLAALAQDRFDEKLETLAKPIYFVSETTPGHVLLKAFLRRRTHLFGVVDEYGGLTGIVTLEDVLESLIGEEIVDELDTAVDMQQVARLRGREQLRKSATEGEEASGGADEC